jgi:pyruvate dehydrogenase E2 component (dihydrolipoamide acetyltransferase)
VVEVIMPKMGATMTEGTVSAWRVLPGQSVAVGDVLCEVETDKASVDVESEHAGTVESLLVNEGETVAIGVPIARLAT